MEFYVDSEAVTKMIKSDWRDEDWKMAGMRGDVLAGLKDFVLFRVAIGDVTVGCAAMDIHDDCIVPIAQLAVYVLREFRGHGYGRVMTRELHSLAKREGVKIVFGEVDNSNAKMRIILDGLGADNYPWLNEGKQMFRTIL